MSSLNELILLSNKLKVKTKVMGIRNLAYDKSHASMHIISARITFGFSLSERIKPDSYFINCKAVQRFADL